AIPGPLSREWPWFSRVSLAAVVRVEIRDAWMLYRVWCFYRSAPAAFLLVWYVFIFLSGYDLAGIT
ncbi:hypothetical protein, partial [Vulcanococcus sp. Clear-D1]|uniref:hypothetical protein n=1 Tax=Vulcanococcus sp. Clear-D1 TaxID=2766970 RepID=UPI0025D5770E